ncbi:MAG: hypothetical protein AAFV29_14735, partial [Myxococcota bacterium]
MKRSFVKLTVNSVFAFWLAGAVVLFLYVKQLGWTEERARRHGVLLAYQILNDLPPSSRAERLPSIRADLDIELALVGLDEVASKIGWLPEPGARIPHRDLPRRAWFFCVFEDGDGALMAGPVDPIIPKGFIPIGMLIVIFGLPILVVWIARRVERQLAKIEQA